MNESDKTYIVFFFEKQILDDDSKNINGTILTFTWREYFGGKKGDGLEDLGLVTGGSIYILFIHAVVFFHKAPT